MNESKKIIAQMIESGEYFDDAKEWYALKYIYLYTQRAYILILAVTSVIFALLTLQINLSDTMTVKKPFPIYAQDETKYYAKIAPIAHGEEPIAISVARYLSEQYVIKRESYDYKVISTPSEWKKALSEIRQLSSRRVFNSYLDYYSTEINPNSPILVFKDNSKRTAKVTKVDFPKISDSPSSATVYYQVIDEGQIKGIKSCVAYLNFSMTNIDSVVDKKTPLQFTVTNYHTSEDKQNNNKAIF